MIKEIYTLYVERWHFFLDLTWEHLQISLTSIVIATIVGLGLGIMISMYRKGSSTVLGLTNFIYTIPSIALFGFLIPFSGIGNTTAIIALSIYALLPMVHNTYTGIIGIDKEIIEAAWEWAAQPSRYSIKYRFLWHFLLSCREYVTWS